MRLLIVVFVSLLAAPALAYDLRNLSPQDVLLLGEALDAMPHGKVANLYNRLQQQISAEDMTAAADARAKTEKEIRDRIAPAPTGPESSKKDKPNE